LNELKNEDALKQFEEQLHDRFGPVPEQVFELFDAMRLKWVATKLGMEQIILKGRHLRCYFIQNQESTFYSSSVFTNILQYVQQHKQGMYLRETEKFLVLNFDNVRSMRDAEEKLKALSEFVHRK